MKFSINQLAIAAYWLVAGKDGRVDSKEVNEGLVALKHSSIFDEVADDWELIKGLYVTGNLSWDEITGFVSELPLLRRYQITRLIVQGVKKTKGHGNKDVDGWPALEQFCKDTGIIVKAYNVLAKFK